MWSSTHFLNFSSFPSAREGCRVDPILSIIGVSQVISFLVTLDVTFAFTPHFILSHRGGWIVGQIFRSGHICLVKTDVLLCFPLTLKLFSQRVACHTCWPKIMKILRLDFGGMKISLLYFLSHLELLFFSLPGVVGVLTQYLPSVLEWCVVQWTRRGSKILAIQNLRQVSQIKVSSSDILIQIVRNVCLFCALMCLLMVWK